MYFWRVDDGQFRAGCYKNGNDMEYSKVLIRKEKDGAAVKDTVADFGVWCAEMPLDIGMTVKEPTVRDWKDEDGEEAYTDGGLMLGAYDLTAKWAAKGPHDSVRASVRRFLDYLGGRDGSGVKMEVYCEWTGTGRRHVRLKSVGSAKLDRSGGEDVVTWETVLRVEDPVTEVALTKG